MEDAMSARCIKLAATVLTLHEHLVGKPRSSVQERAAGVDEPARAAARFFEALRVRAHLRHALAMLVVEPAPRGDNEENEQALRGILRTFAERIPDVSPDGRFDRSPVELFTTAAVRQVELLQASVDAVKSILDEHEVKHPFSFDDARTLERYLQRRLGLRVAWNEATVAFDQWPRDRTAVVNRNVDGIASNIESELHSLDDKLRNFVGEEPAVRPPLDKLEDLSSKFFRHSFPPWRDMPAWARWTANAPAAIREFIAPTQLLAIADLVPSHREGLPF